MSDPHDSYLQRLGDRQRLVGTLERTSARFSTARMVVFLVGVGLLWPIVFARSLGGWWILAPVLLFVGLAVAHERVIRRLRLAGRAVTFYRAGLDRLEHRWVGQGNRGSAFVDESHPFAADLDIFGSGSLFELICRARTRIGERTLADWLAVAASPDEILERQAAVLELRDRLDLREAIHVLGDEVREDDDPDGLSAWSAAPPVLTGRWPVVGAALLGLLGYAVLAAWLAAPEQRLPLLGLLAFGGLFAAWFRRRVLHVLHAAERPERELELLSGVLERLEQERFESPLLGRLRVSLDGDGEPPSRRVARLARLVQLRDSRENKLFAPFAALGLLGTQLAFAMERWRVENGAAVRRWLDVVGRFEALASLAGAAYERPEDVMPVVESGAPRFEAEGLGHPLLPDADCVRNDVALGSVSMMLVSGSNMSGKSTLLRTVGVNAALAQAGGTVRARRLRMTSLQVGACMRIRDSLLDGTSHFYAEIKRLRSIVDLAGDDRRPLIFLLDEILHGTNSRDRRAGAAAVIRGLLDRGAIGLVTTHDLALATIAEELGPRAANVHFEDSLDGERIAFDYRLRPGVVTRGNALGLMRAVGLDV